MAKRYTSVLGVDVGSQSVKVAEIKLLGRQPSVTALGMAPTPQGAVDHIGVHDPDSVALALRQAIGESGASCPDAVVSLSGQGSVLVRTLEVPNMSDGELKQHMEWEITRNVPFAESTVESDFKAYPPMDPAAQNLDVVMAIATRSSVDTLVSMLKKAGKKAAALDVEPLSLLRLLSNGYQGALSGKYVCILDIGHKTSSINIYKDDRLMMPRQVPVGGEMFTRAISDMLGMSFDDAANAKHTQVDLPASAAAAVSTATQPVQTYNPFSADPDAAPAPAAEAPVVAAPGSDNRFYSALSQPLDELVSEVRRSIDYFKSKGGDVDMILISGGGSQLKNLDKFLASAVGVPTEVLDPFRGVQVSAKKSDPGELDATKSEYAVAIGNGLHILY